MSDPTTPPLPESRPPHFRTTVHGTAFGNRSDLLDRIRAGDELLLVPGPPVDEEPEVWVHLKEGDPVGHLPPEIQSWLAPWMLRGGHATARALRVHGDDVPSWRRLVIEVDCAV